MLLGLVKIHTNIDTILISFISLIFINLVSCSNLTAEVLEQTIPAYTISLKSDLLTESNSNKCKNQLEIFRKSVDNQIFWALRILDANGKPSVGFIAGNNFWIGSKNLCLDISNPRPLMVHQKWALNNSKYRNPNEEYSPYDLNYFVARFHHNSTKQYHFRLPYPAEDMITLGLCLPNSCSEKDVTVLLEKVFSERKLLFNDLFVADFRLISVSDLKDDFKWAKSWQIITTMVIVFFSFFMVFTGTMYDLIINRKSYNKENLMKSNNLNKENIDKEEGNSGTVDSTASATTTIIHSKFGNILLCFSAYNNTKIIFNKKLDSDSIPVIHGLRCLGMVWIIMIHAILFNNDYLDNRTYGWRRSEEVLSQILNNGTLSVDTYFFMAGFLLAWMFFKSRKKIENESKVITSIRWTDFYYALLKRIIRTTPTYMIILGIVELNAASKNKTSILHISENHQELCAKYWWRNLLYINNLFTRETMCLSWSWYISNDMQFFIIGTFLLLLSDVYFFTSAILLCTILILSIIVSGYLTYFYEYIPTNDEFWNTLDIFYDRPWMRIGPYLIGIIAAYILTKINKEMSLKKKTLCVFWTVGIFFNLVTLLGIYERQISVSLSILYTALSRTVWSIGIAWLVIACTTHHGGIINKILKLKIWIPFSRLTFCAYLLNPMVISAINLNSETPMHLDGVPNFVTFLGLVIVVYTFSYAASLMFETPYILLLRLFTGPRQHNTSIK